MPLARFQKVAIAALCSLLLLILAGAIVRVSGAGMGCPDWPTCWGCLVPPTKLEDVDFSRLKIDKFKEKAKREGRDPDTITQETLRSEFNPRLAWTEYLNRLCTLPLSIFAVATFVLASKRREARPGVFWAAFATVVLILVTAWLGARIVHSGLKPVIITAHLALAMMMFGLLTYCAWRGSERPWQAEVGEGLGPLRVLVGLLLLVVVAEGIMGSQIREITDELARSHQRAPRSEWIGGLERTWIYLVHRSFSWAVLGMTLAAYFSTKRHGRPGRVEKTVLAVVLGQMVLGVIMSWVNLYAWVQVVHVVLAAVLLTFAWLWLFGVSRRRVD